MPGEWTTDAYLVEDDRDELAKLVQGPDREFVGFMGRSTRGGPRCGQIIIPLVRCGMWACRQ